MLHKIKSSRCNTKSYHHVCGSLLKGRSRKSVCEFEIFRTLFITRLWFLYGMCLQHTQHVDCGYDVTNYVAIFNEFLFEQYTRQRPIHYKSYCPSIPMSDSNTDWMSSHEMKCYKGKQWNGQKVFRTSDTHISWIRENNRDSLQFATYITDPQISSYVLAGKPLGKTSYRVLTALIVCRSHILDSKVGFCGVQRGTLIQIRIICFSSFIFKLSTSAHFFQMFSLSCLHSCILN